MLEVYINSCSSCGMHAGIVARVEKYARDNDMMYALHNTKYSKPSRDFHLNYIKEAGLDPSRYEAIVVQDQKKITRLTEWSL